MMTKILLSIYFLASAVALSKQDAPEVTIEQGTLRGKFWQSKNGRTFSGFHRIPYAEPPVGDLRFKPAVPAGPWKDVLDASNFKYTQCPQMNPFLNNFNIKGEEDCLYLNVYTPQLPDSSKELLPVMVFIHGGGFVCGHSDPSWFGPTVLLNKDIVLVTINYRLGALGFLSMEDEILPGNNGLKDQSLAIKWVKKNIANFGGDPEKITVFGQSAGGASAHYHVLSHLSKGLIRGAIAQSGVATAKWAIAEKGEAVQNAKKLGKLLNCPTSSTQELVECLRKVDAYEIVNQDLKFMEWSYDPLVPFKPVIEPNIEGAFITKHPVDIIKSGEAGDVPFISGVTTEDGAFKSAGIYDDFRLLNDLNNDFNKVLPIVLQYEHYPNRDDISNKIRGFYLGNKKADQSTRFNVTYLFTDGLFVSPQDVALELHAKYSKQPVYSYIFGFRGSISASMFFGDALHDYGVCHMDELIYIFSNKFFPNYKPKPSEQKITDAMVTLWTNFAKTGNPTPETNPLITNKWEPVQADNLKYYYIKDPNDLRMIDDVYAEKVKFWKSLSYIQN